MPYTLTVNGRRATVDVPADTPLLWVIRDVLNLKGTKLGCTQANDYLLAHQGVSPRGALQGMAPYVRTVSEQAVGPRR